MYVRCCVGVFACYRDLAMSCSGSCSQKTKALVSMLCRATASEGVEGSVKPVCGVKRARPSRESQQTKTYASSAVIPLA